MEMEENFSDTGFSVKNSMKFFYRWRKVLLIVLVAAVVASAVASFLIQPRYKSTAVLFPTSSNRTTKSIMADRYSMDIVDYGGERDCEYALQILSSQSMMEDVCNRFNLMEHYGIDGNAKDKFARLGDMYRAYVSVKRTEFLGIEVSVEDVDPQMAADIANYITTNYDTICTEILMPRTVDALNVMRGVCERLEAEIVGLDDSLGGMYNYSDYTNRMYQELARQTASGNTGAANRIKDEIASHRTAKGSFADIDNLLKEKQKELAELQTQVAERQAEVDMSVSHKFWVDKAVPADKKSFPKRAMIILLGTFAAELMLILVLLIAERWKTWTAGIKEND